MHIGIDARYLGTSSSGLAQYSENLLNALARIDETNEYTVFIGGAMHNRLKVGRNFRVVRMHGNPNSPRSMLRMNLALRGMRLDFFHVHHPLGPILTDVRTLLTVHDMFPYKKVEAKTRVGPIGWGGLIRWLLLPWSVSRAIWIVCVSGATRDGLTELYPEVYHKSIVVHSGVEERYREPLPDEIAADTLAELKMPEKYILYSGPPWASKNIPRMIQAFALLRHQDPRAENYKFVLDLTESAEKNGPIRSTIARYKIDEHVVFTDRPSFVERQAIYQGAALMFFASKSEGFGFPAIRAQLSGVPVIVADAGALPEICGQAGLLVDPDDVDDMIAMLSRALFDEPLRQYLISEGKENAARFSWDETARRVKEIYELLF